MYRTSRKHDICFEGLEETLAECSKTQEHPNLLCGGWPCQGNSQANRKREGHKDERSGLWFEFRRLIELFRPEWVVAENVPGLFTVNNGKDFWGVISDLDSLGYCVAWRVLDSQDFGVPQRRKRIFIVASLGNTNAAKVLFEQSGDSGNVKKVNSVPEVGLCISTRDGQRHDPTAETLIASVITASDYKRTQIGQFGNEGNLVAYTVTTDDRGHPQHINQTNLIAQANTNGEGIVARIPKELDTPRGIIIGNAVTVPVAKWIGQRIMQFDIR